MDSASRRKAHEPRAGRCEELSRKTRYAQVGLGVRSWMFSIAMVNTYPDACELVGLCDSNAGRLAQRADWARANDLRVGAYAAEGFDRMLTECRPDCVVVTTVDRDHDDYICRAMEHGCDVVTEKPLTIDAARCQRILDTQRKTGRRCRVAFNYRYSPPRGQVKELLLSGAIGEVFSVDFQWRLDTRHGADYFRRWHRRKENSGGLLVHKATHHFDLVNWWLSDVPRRVYASGARRYYRAETADRLGLSDRSDRCLDCAASSRCPFFLDLRQEAFLKAIYLDHEHHDGYWRDGCVFSDQIDIEDVVSAVVDYRAGVRMSYSLHAFAAQEGYSVAFNGSRGRLEHHCHEESYTSGDSAVPGLLPRESAGIRVLPLREAPRDIPIREAEGGHGGGDQPLLADLFDPASPPDPLLRAADQRAGAWSILTGVAANRSIETGEPVDVDTLVAGLALPDFPDRLNRS